MLGREKKPNKNQAKKEPSNMMTTISPTLRSYFADGGCKRETATLIATFEEELGMVTQKEISGRKWGKITQRTRTSWGIDRIQECPLRPTSRARLPRPQTDFSNPYPKNKDRAAMIAGAATHPSTPPTDETRRIPSARARRVASPIGLGTILADLRSSPKIYGKSSSLP